MRYGVKHHDGANGHLPTVPSQFTAGAVRAQHADLQRGQATATVQMRRPGIAVLSASYDPGWTATVNGRHEPIRMVAPALVAVNVPAGTDHVVFRFHGHGGYPELLALTALTLATIAIAPMCLWRARRRRASTSARSHGTTGAAAPTRATWVATRAAVDAGALSIRRPRHRARDQRA